MLSNSQKKHNNPIQRSAFTYCEEEQPSRMDFGKEKYGGPFTTEQVEDVKVFLGILCVLLSFGPTFTVDLAAVAVLPKFANIMDKTIDLKVMNIGDLIPVLIVILIPLYIFVLRPFIGDYIPGMLKRIGLGILLLLLSALCTLVMDIVGHLIPPSTDTCFLAGTVTPPNSSGDDHMKISSYFLVIQSTLNSIAYMLIDISAYEFICAQSPQAMKGLLIGIYFAIKGVFQLFGALTILTPFSKWNVSSSRGFPSCGFAYYIINIAIGTATLVVYTWVAKHYKYRQRDEPDNIYRYAEEYYEKEGGDSISKCSDYNEESYS